MTLPSKEELIGLYLHDKLKHAVWNIVIIFLIVATLIQMVLLWITDSFGVANALWTILIFGIIYVYATWLNYRVDIAMNMLRDTINDYENIKRKLTVINETNNGRSQ